jgi:hypothetical protein
MATFEMAGFLLHWLALELITPSLHHITAEIWCDNIAALTWASKLKSSKDSIATELLRILAMRMYCSEASPFQAHYVDTADNATADFASRKHPTDPALFLHSFTATFPPPQNNYWHMFQFPTEILSRIFSTLRQQPLTMASWKQLPLKGAGFGRLGHNSSRLISRVSRATYITSQSNSNAWNCWQPLPNTYGRDVIQQNASKYEVPRYHWHYEPLQQTSCWLENQTQWSLRKERSTKPWPNDWRDTDVQTHLLNLKLQSLSL